MVSPRFALATGFAASVGAGLILAGRAPGSVLAVAALVLAARAAATAVAERVDAAGSLARQASSVPAWVVVVGVGVLRAGSVDVEDLRGAHAVFGLAVVHGHVLAVAAALVAALLGLIVIGMACGRSSFFATEDPFVRLEAVAVAVQIWLVVALFVGPQVRAPIDLVPWVAGVLLAGIGVSAVARLAKQPWLPRVANGLAVVATVLAVTADRS